MPPKEYNVVVRGEDFILSDEQLNFDAPNYFTEYFGTTEATVVRLSRNRNPRLFQIIEDYLSGYDILPLPDSAGPSHMSRENISKNLLADARFYGLSRLVDKLDSANSPQPLSLPLVSGPMDVTPAVVPAIMVPPEYESWFTGSDSETKWRMKTLGPQWPHSQLGGGPKHAWHDSGEFGSDMARSWIARVHGSPRYKLVPMPNHWPSELEHVISWIDNFSEHQCIYVIMGKVRPESDFE